MKKTKYKISTYIFVPVMSVISILMIALLLIFSYGDVVTNITNESYDSLKEKAENERNYLEHKMTYEWSKIETHLSEISNIILKYVIDNQYDIENVFDNADVNSEILALVSNDLVSILRDTKTTGAYIIFDGKTSAANANEQVKPGFYVRDSDPYVNSAYNTDVLIETALPKLCEQVELPLSSTWSATFDFSSDKYTSTDFYYKPFEAYAMASLSEKDVTDITNFGYWSGSYKTDPAGDEIISYSIPLVVSGHLAGVVGIDVSLDLISSVMTEYLDVDNSISFIFGHSNNIENQQLHIIQKIGTMYTKYFKNAKKLEYMQGENGSYDLFQPDTKDKDMVVSYIIPLKVYNNNTPFDSTTWMVAVCKSKAEVMEYTTWTRKYILLFIGIVLLSMAAALAFICKNITRPVKNLAKEVKNSSLSVNGRFTETKIKEVNELITSFEIMRKIILDNSNKMSEIVSLTKLSLGVYEYDSSVGMTFCSESLLDMFSWREYAQDGYISDELFRQKILELTQTVYDKENNIYEISDETSGTRWIQIHSMTVDSRDIGTIVDVSVDVINQMKLEYERDYDVLTGLLNRRAFQTSVAALIDAKTNTGIAAMMMLDSDNLKFINDTYGHETGDVYLKKIAKSFQFFQNISYVAGRFSGDEFYLFLYGFDSIEEIRALIEKYWDSLRAQYIMLPDGSDFNIRCSAGVSWYPQDSEEILLLEQYADFAMYEMKHNSKGCWAEFDRGQYEKKEIFLNGHKALELLLSRKMIKHMFQPIIAVCNGTVFGYEMLMRSQISEFATPIDILQMARSQSRLHELEYVSIYKSFEGYYREFTQGNISHESKIFINSIGSESIQKKQLEALMKEFPHDNYDKFVIELTEEEECSLEDLVKKSTLINDAGLELAIDDYGTGYSNLINMLTINPSYIKVDMSIIRNIDMDEERQFILRQAISLARTKAAMVVAEGIENSAELKCVMDLGVDLVQGFYLGKPSYEFDSLNYEALEFIKNESYKKLL